MFNLDEAISLLICQELSKRDKEISNDETLKVVTRFMDESLPKTSDSLLRNLKKRAPKMLVEHRNSHEAFRKRLFGRWKKCFDLMEMLYVIAVEAGDEINHGIRKGADFKKGDNSLTEVVTRSHARGCQIYYEIYTLLKNGLADGAHARWRSLHELTVILFFIIKHAGNVAKRYLDYNQVESYKQAGTYNKHCRKLGYKAFSQREMAKMQLEYDSCLKLYGKEFKNKYSWVPDGILRSKTFDEIEQNVEFDMLRPYYKMACNNVHADPKSLGFKLGLMEIKGREILLAGPSNYGLADPAQLAALSLFQLTICLVKLSPTYTNLMILKMIEKLQRDISLSAVDIQFKIEDDEKRIQKNLNVK